LYNSKKKLGINLVQLNERLVFINRLFRLV